VVRFEFGDFVLDDSAFELRRAGATLKVEPKVLDLLAHVVRRPGQLVTKDELIEHVWQGRALSDTVLTGTISRLRKVLGAEGDELLVTVYGRGYRFTGTVRAIAVEDPAPAAATEPSPPPAASDAPFVGRGGAVERVAAGLDRVRAGSGRIAVVAGEPGIGKTRLAEVAADRAQKLGMPVAWSHCRAQGAAPPYWPFVQLLRGSLRAPPTAGVTAVERALAVLAPEAGSPPTEWSADPASYTLFDVVLGALQALSDDRARLLIVDDLQWADQASLRLLAYLAPEIAHLRLLFMATARNTEPAARELLSPICGHRNCEYIELERLTEADVARYAALRLPRASDELCRALFRKSEGNAFFMVELLRPFHESENPRSDALALSGPALDIVRQRVENLSREARDLLSAAAVLGRDFDLALAGQVAEFDPAALQEIVDQALATHTLVALTDRPGHYAFGHELICSVLYDALPAKESARLHFRAAQALERRFPPPNTAHRPEIVHHLLSAAPLGDIDHTLRQTMQAALSYFQVGAHADAAALLRRALFALDLSGAPLTRVKADLLMGLSYCERAIPEPGYAEHFAEAVALAEREGYGDLLAEAGQRMVGAPGYIPVARAREVLEAADRALAPDADALRAMVLACLSWTAPYCFDRERAQALAARATALAARSGDHDARVVALVAEHYLEGGAGNSERAQAILQRIEALRGERPSSAFNHWVAQAYYSQMVIALQRGDHAAVDRTLAAYADAAETTKHAEMKWHCARVGWVQRLNRGEWQDAAKALEELQACARAKNLFAAESVCLADWVVVLRETNGAALTARPEFQIAPEPADYPARWARKIRFLAEVGELDRARLSIEQRPAESLERLPRDRDYLGALAHLALAVIATECKGHAEALYALLVPHGELYAADIRLHCDGSVAHFLGLLARALGREAEAERHLEQAVERNQRAFPGRAAHSLYQLGRLEAVRGAKRARALFSDAIETGRRLGMLQLARDAERALGEL